MRRLREHIYRLCIRRCVADISAALMKSLQIAGECRGVAAHIDDALRRHAKHGINKFRCATLARRIENHYVRMYAL